MPAKKAIISYACPKCDAQSTARGTEEHSVVDLAYPDEAYCSECGCEGVCDVERGLLAGAIERRMNKVSRQAVAANNREANNFGGIDDLLLDVFPQLKRVV